MPSWLNRSQLVLVAALLAAGLAQFFSNHLDSYVLSVAMGVGINIVLASSLNLINGFTGQFSLGHAGFMAVGAYTSAVLTGKLAAQLNPIFGGHIYLLFPFALVVGGLVAAVAGGLVGAPSLRLKGDYLAIVTLGFGEIIKVIFQNVEFVGGAKGLNAIPDYSNLFWVFGTTAITVYTVWALLNSTYGRGFLAVADDEISAEAMGLNTTRYKMVAFVVGAFFAGIAGGLFAHLNNSINPSGFDFNKSIEIVVMVILGGMGRHTGVILSAILLTVLTELLRQFGDYRMVIYSLLLIVLMILRPQGLMVWPFKNPLWFYLKAYWPFRMLARRPTS
jgi:branched-chain amino acid transport system permease protein